MLSMATDGKFTFVVNKILIEVDGATKEGYELIVKYPRWMLCFDGEIRGKELMMLAISYVNQNPTSKVLKYFGQVFKNQFINNEVNIGL